MAEQLGIDEVFSEVLAKDNDQTVSELQGRGRIVAMVGDGVNDVDTRCGLYPEVVVDLAE